MIKSNKRMAYAALILALVPALFSGCGQRTEKQSDTGIETLSFRNIPGITRSEITAIEALRTQYGSFVYGINLTTEAFTWKDGELDGYAVLFCKWLSDLFGIVFKPVYYEWGDLLEGLESGEVDFTGELMTTSDNQSDYFMSSPTINRTIKGYRIEGARSIEEILRTRLPRYAFLRGAVIADDIDTNTPTYSFERVIVDSHREAHQLLKSGAVDTFFGLDTAVGAFDIYGDVKREDFFPLIFRSSCLSAYKEELNPIISVIDKALVMNTNVLEYLTGLQKKGYDRYLINRMDTLLTEEERLYILKHPVVPIAADFSNYPISFFDKRANKWEGIYFEALGEISRFTGLKFEIGNSQNEILPNLVNKVEKGELLIIPELFQIKDYEGRFLWSEVPLLNDSYAFISKADLRNIDVNDVFHLRVGIRKDTPYLEIFKTVFPSHQDYTLYDTQEVLWAALDRGDYDIMFASRRRLLIYTNYDEESGYKLNLVFNHWYNSYFGYNKDAVLLKSIIDKALRIIDIDNISSQWIYKTYDYRRKVAAAQRPWFIGAVVLSVLVLALMTILWRRSRSAGKELEDMVKHRTKDLAFQTSKLQAMFDSVPDIMFCKDINCKYTQCNRSFEKFMGRNEASMMGLTDRDGTWFTPEHLERICNEEQTLIAENRIITLEEKVTSPITGKERIFETVRAPIRQDEDVVGIIAIVRDITQRKEMEDEVQAASRAKSAFLANMSHELRTPLNVVIGLTDLVLEDENLEKHVTDNLVKINSAGTTLLSIVNDILDFSKIESGKMELNPVEYHVSSLLNDVITLVITRLGEKPIKFTLDIEDNLPGMLYGDDLRVKQVFTNLLTNAVKYTRQGSIVLKVRCMQEGDYVWMDVSVTDTGIGIQKEDIKHLFTDYYQTNTTANRNIEGTGLGLPITKRLVKMMAGEISVESEHGHGSTFSLRIRQGVIKNAQPLGTDISDKLRNFCYDDDKRINTKKLVRLNLSYARVLVVDDMETNLDVAAGLLSKYKMQVDCALSGQEAIEKIRAGTPVYNAIFMDHMMPGMDGIEAADRIRAIGTEYAKNIPIIALTANAIQGTDRMFFEHGFQAFTTKPIDVIELDAVIRKWVRDDKRQEVTVADDSSTSEDIEIKIPGVDTEKGLSLYAGDTKVYLPMLRSYVTNTPVVLEKLRNVSAETLPAYVITVHGLKGTSAGIGAEKIREAALDLEGISRAGDYQGVLKLNGGLIVNAEIVVGHIKEWLRKHDAAHKETKPRQKAPDRELLAQLRECFNRYDMGGIDKVMSELERFDYEEGADIIVLLREKIEAADFDEAIEKITQYEEGLKK